LRRAKGHAILVLPGNSGTLELGNQVKGIYEALRA
jgi:uncharacterized protein YdaU (DUF1376 family)